MRTDSDYWPTEIPSFLSVRSESIRHRMLIEMEYKDIVNDVENTRKMWHIRKPVTVKVRICIFTNHTIQKLCKYFNCSISSQQIHYEMLSYARWQGTHWFKLAFPLFPSATSQFAFFLPKHRSGSHQHWCRPCPVIVTGAAAGRVFNADGGRARHAPQSRTAGGGLLGHAPTSQARWRYTLSILPWRRPGWRGEAGAPQKPAMFTLLLRIRKPLSFQVWGLFLSILPTPLLGSSLCRIRELTLVLHGNGHGFYFTGHFFSFFSQHTCHSSVKSLAPYTLSILFLLLS